MTDPVEVTTQVVEETVVEKQAGGFEDLLSTIKSEDGRQKYSDVETALTSITHKDEHIKKLEDENAQLRVETEKRAALEEVLEQIKTQQADATEVTPSVSGLDGDAVLDLVKTVLNEDKQQATAKKNAASIFDALQEKYSDKSMVIFEAQAQELGMSKEELTKMASTKPLAVRKLLGLDLKRESSTPLTSSVNTATLAQQNQQPVERKKVMLGGSTKDVVAAWNRHKKTN